MQKLSRVKLHIVVLLVLVLGMLFIWAGAVIYIDPFFHYHRPMEQFYYTRDDTVERYCNDGVFRHFDYDAVITGVSVCSGFSKSEFDSLFGTSCEKVIYLGGTNKEVGEGITRALETHPDTRIILNSLFSMKLIQDRDHRRSDITDHPTYLFNNNPFDDVNYLFNKDVMYNYIFPMIEKRLQGLPGGSDSHDSGGYLDVAKEDIQYFDSSELWEQFGQKSGKVEQPDISQEEIEMVTENVKQNIMEPALKYPGTRFIYFLPPVSILYYKDLYEAGNLKKTIQAEELAVELLLDVPNIEVYSFDHQLDIIENLDNYSDSVHYGGWINTFYS